ncbi:MAG TPA: hypothetical protein VM370_09875 [Candidatus Thermoplasmatota archaeon]|nr:hypothetical protein [Candidatus Thermoplasmatota archaeon]
MRALLLVAALLAAGCVSPAAKLDALQGKSPNEILPTLDVTDAHDHKDPAQHDATWNMELLGWDPVAPDTTKLGRYNHVNVQGTRAYVTAYHLANGTPPGLAVFNLSTPDPQLVGTLETPELSVIDVHGTPDGKYVVLAGHRDARVADNVPSQVSGFCTGTPGVNLCAPYVPYGVILVDVSDEAHPTVAARWISPPSGAHTAKIVQFEDGSYYVFIASYGFSYANRVASHVEILKVEDSPAGIQLRPVSEFAPSRPSGNDGATSTFVHDMYVAEHPIAGMLMWIAYWDGGVVLVDVNDPAAPRELADWRDFDSALYGNIHFTRPVGMIGDRHITLATPEFGSAPHAGEAYVLDTTDPAAPALLAKWTLPGDPVNDGGYRFSPHNFDPQGTKVVYAHYHGGVWVLDLATPEAPQVKGYVFPTVPAGEPAFNATEDAPNVWAAVWAADGTIYASDIGTGLYHYRLVSDAPGVPPYEAALDAAS